MKVIQRSEIQILMNRLNEENTLIQAITGPRQVGKSTMVKQVLEMASIPVHYVSADAVPNSDTKWVEQQWDLARLKALESKGPVVLAIDEIQKIYQWSDAVKKCFDWDQWKNIKVKPILLGSSKLVLQQGLAESLAGRFEEISLTHWRYNEMKEAFGFTPEQYVWYGAYPGAVQFIHDEDRWKTFVRDALIETAISKDILQLTRVDKPALLRRLFELGSKYSGKILSYTKVLGQLQDAGNTTTLSHYLHLLNNAGLLAGLEKYAVDTARRRSSSPKFQTLNPALVNAMRVENFESIQQDPAAWGHVVESGIGAWLMTFRKEGFEITYWRQGDKEVDFVITYKGKTIAIEVKTAVEKTPGLETFVQLYRPQHAYTIGPGGIPWQELLQMHLSTLFQ